MANPPVLAEELLHALLHNDTRETVSGDLLEEYRESRVPAAGRLRADLWYWRQVGGMWVRAYWWLVVPAVLFIVIHDVFNTFRAPSGASYLDGLPGLARAVMSPLGVLGPIGLAAAYGTWRTERWEGGFVAALGTSVFVWVFMAVWGNATFYPFAQVMQSNPYWVQAWHWSTNRAGTPEETFLHWAYWDGVGALIIGGLAMFVASCLGGGLSGILLAIRTRRRARAS